MRKSVSDRELQRRARQRFMSMGQWTHYSGMSRSGTFLAIGRGLIRAVKDGRRLKIDVDSGDAYLDTLPAANIRRPAA